MRTYAKYVKGETEITAEGLDNLAGIGADVLYIVTGKHSVISEEEEALLAAYRQLNLTERLKVLNMANEMSIPENNLRVRGNVGQYVEGNMHAPFTMNVSHAEKKSKD